MKNIKRIYRFIKRYSNDYWNSRELAIKQYNCSSGNFNNYADKVPIKKHWLYQFIVAKNYLNNKRHSISLFSVHGDRWAIKINRSKYKIFYTLENVHVKDSYWQKYEDLLLCDENIDLSLGFDYLEHNKYLRFPYWLMTVFEPTETYETIKKKCELINNTTLDQDKKNKFCSFICRNDYFGDRKYFFELINSIDKVSCPGLFMHNDDELKILYKDNKRTYLRNFKFNLCPENSNSEGYVTEKIFDSILAGCIPIYWGSNNNPEPNIINQNKILFLNLKEDNSVVLEKIKNLWNDSDTYQSFISQPPLLENAAEEIYNHFKRLDDFLRKTIK